MHPSTYTSIYTHTHVRQGKTCTFKGEKIASDGRDRDERPRIEEKKLHSHYTITMPYLLLFEPVYLSPYLDSGYTLSLVKFGPRQDKKGDPRPMKNQ